MSAAAKASTCLADYRALEQRCRAIIDRLQGEEELAACLADAEQLPAYFARLPRAEQLAGDDGLGALLPAIIAAVQAVAQAHAELKQALEHRVASLKNLAAGDHKRAVAIKAYAGQAAAAKPRFHDRRG